MRFLTLQSKDVIDASSGCKIGYVVDLEIDPCCQCIQALIVERFSAFKFIITGCAPARKAQGS